MKEIIIAVVVTHNRFELLKRVIKSLKNQTVPLDRIIIINNGSTDGTTEYLRKFEGLNDSMDQDVAVINQDNVGGSGGFYRGIQEAQKLKYDWIWCMDDDVFPRPDCLETLISVGQQSQDIGIVCPKRMMDNNIFVTENVDLNLSNIFKPLHGRLLSHDEVNGITPTSIKGMTFEGPLVSRRVVDKIGLPMKDLFILYDDTEYSYRAVVNGFRVMYCPTAVMDKHNFGQKKTWEEQVIGNKWKLWYDNRNAAFFAHHYGENWVFKEFGAYPLRQLFAIIANLPFNKKYRFSDLYKLLKMDRAGRKEILGRL